MVMAVFAYIYHQSFVVPQSYSVEMILNQVNFALLITIEVTCNLREQENCYHLHGSNPINKGEGFPICQLVSPRLLNPTL